jgi:hypothetical protein
MDILSCVITGSLFNYYTRTGAMPADFETKYNLADSNEDKGEKLHPSTTSKMSSKKHPAINKAAEISETEEPDLVAEISDTEEHELATTPAAVPSFLAV